jgi:hypothetical protein
MVTHCMALVACRLTYIAELMKEKYSGVGRWISLSIRYFSILSAECINTVLANK